MGAHKDGAEDAGHESDAQQPATREAAVHFFLSWTTTPSSDGLTSTSPALIRMPSSILVATTEPSKTSSAKRQSLPCFRMRTITPCGLRHTPSPDGLKPRVISSPRVSGMTSGGGLGAGQRTGWSWAAGRGAKIG